MYKRKIRKLIIKVSLFFSLMLIWHLFDYFLKIREVILPNPLEILNAFYLNFSLLFTNNLITMFEAFSGFLIGSFLGFLLATLFIYSKSSKEAIYPYTIALKATPVIALAPLLNLWFGTGISSKIIMSSLIVFFPVLVSSVKGLSALGENSLNLFKSLNASKTQIFLKLRFPNSLSYLFPSLKVATTFSIVGATIAEFTGASKGIGYLIIHSSYYLNTSIMFASIVMLAFSGILFFYFIDYLEKKVLFWQ
jgi:NitT/TauT family transport system permease protein